MLPLLALGKNPSLTLPSFSVALGSPTHSLAYSCIRPVSASVLTWLLSLLSPLLIMTPVIGLTAHTVLTWYDLISILNYSQTQRLLPNKVTFCGSQWA